MTEPIPKEKMTAWQRWELSDFNGRPPTPAPEPAAPPPPPPEPEPEPQPAMPDIKFPTLEEIEQIHTQAHQDGYTAGYEEGTARVRMEAMHLNTLAENLDAAFGALDKDVAESLLALSLEIARQVVRQQIAAKPDVILQVVKEALMQLPHQHASIYLHPEDANLVRAYLGDQLGHAGHRFFEEPEMERGGCRIEAAGSQIDGTVDTRWQRVIESMGMKGGWVEQPDERA